MKNILNKVLSLSVWAALALYLIWAVKQCTTKERDTPANGVEISVKDSSSIAVITPAMVKAWIAAEGFIKPNMSANEIPVAKIEKLVRSRGFVKDAKVYVDLDGKVHVEIHQRQPVMRFNTYTGYNFYLTDDNYILPAQSHAAMWLPVITGNYTLPFARDYVGSLDKVEKKMDENYQFLYNLISFVKFISNDDFWSAHIEQVNVIEQMGSDQGGSMYNRQVEIVPRAGDHIVMLGALDDYRTKLDKLMLFYRNGLDYEGWDMCKYIDLRYKKQIVCTKE